MNSTLKLMALMAISILMIAPALAAESICAAEQNTDYILRDGYGDGHAFHAEGIQIGYALEIPNTGYPWYHDPAPYLGITEFKLKQSHEEQLKLAMVDHYCGVLRKYDPDNSDPESIVPQVIGVHTVKPTGVSEDPNKSVYVQQHGTRFTN